MSSPFGHGRVPSAIIALAVGAAAPTATVRADEAQAALENHVLDRLTYGATDDLGYNAVEDVVHVHDFHATMLHLLGIDHMKLTYRFQGRDFRLTDVAGNVVTGILT